MNGRRHSSLVIALASLALLGGRAAAQGDPRFAGSWELVPQKSADIDLYGTLSIAIEHRGSALDLVQTWGKGRSYGDTLRLRTDGAPTEVPVRSRVFPSNVFMGLSMPVGEHRTVRAFWDSNGAALRLREDFRIRGSQTLTAVTADHLYSLAEGGDLLLYTVRRSSRTSGPAVRYTLKRTGSRQAFMMRIEDNWEIAGRLPLQAFLISLQGVANTAGPLLYFVYPPDWPFTYTSSVFDFYRDRRSYTFTELRSAEQALDTLKKHVRGYVVWDRNVRTSLVVAFTVAGLEKAVVVTEELLPMVERAGLKKCEDLRGRFAGWNDARIYAWAYDRYWARCSKDCIVWLGGEHGTIMKPAVADWGIFRQVFFNDLSSRPSDSAEYALASRLLAEMKPMSMVMGWHSYAKDLEREHVRLTSSYGHRVEGLHTLPNLSFSAQIPPTPGFRFRNNHHVAGDTKVRPRKKVYVSCIQTDGIGLGAWLKPGRGEIPYAWEVLMNYTWMAPGMAEYFYTMATPNDYFIGCLSGPGYLYPKAVPNHLLPALIALARDQMRQLDLRVFEIMDYSEGATVEGNTELTRDVVDAYFAGMPEAIGFVNGYAPSSTFAVREGRPLVSYDYYLSPVRPEADAVADLQELARINPNRPYFLLVHVRESSDVARVRGILDKLGPEFETVPLDLFLAMAGKQPTFQERYLTRP